MDVDSPAGVRFGQGLGPSASALGDVPGRDQEIYTEIVSICQAPALAHVTVTRYERVFVIHVGVIARVRHSSAELATSSRQKSGISGTKRLIPGYLDTEGTSGSKCECWER